MPKRADPYSAMASIGFFAPLVVGARLQMLAVDAIHPTAKGRREAARMTAEKPAAFLEGSFAAQQAVFKDGLKFWADVARAANAFALAAPAASLAMAMPVRRRVRGNARRLTGL